MSASPTELDILSSHWGGLKVSLQKSFICSDTSLPVIGMGIGADVFANDIHIVDDNEGMTRLGTIGLYFPVGDTIEGEEEQFCRLYQISHAEAPDEDGSSVIQVYYSELLAVTYKPTCSEMMNCHVNSKRDPRARQTIRIEAMNDSGPPLCISAKVRPAAGLGYLTHKNSVQGYHNIALFSPHDDVTEPEDQEGRTVNAWRLHHEWYYDDEKGVDGKPHIALEPSSPPKSSSVTSKLRRCFTFR